MADDDLRRCGECDTENIAGAKFCVNCGSQLAAVKITVAEPSETVTPPSQIDSDNPEPKSRKRMKIVLAVTALVVLAGLATAGAVYKQRSDERKEAAQTRAEARQEAREKAEAKAEFVAENACTEEIADLIAAEEELDSRLDIGLIAADYNTRVGDVHVAYNKVEFDELSPGCISNVGIHAEKALNFYTQAGTTWDACNADFDCSNDSIQPKLQKLWTRASANVELASKGLDESPSY